MKFLDVFIKKPVWALALALAIGLLGVFALTKLPPREFPVFTPSKITITTQYPGASPKVMEGFISTPIQSAIASVHGIDYMSASNKQGQSTVTVKLFQGYDIDKALTQINTRIASIMWKLPKGILNPSIVQQPSSSSAIYLGLTSNTLSLETVSNYFNQQLKPFLQNIKGVQFILDFGMRDYAMRIWLSPSKMAKHGVTPLEVAKAIDEYNTQPAIGQLKDNNVSYNLTANGLLKTPAEFDDIVVKRTPSYLVRLKDVGHAALGTRNDDQAAYINGKIGVVLGIAPDSTTGNIQLADKILKLLPEIRARAPKGLDVSVLWNTSQFSKESVHNVILTIGLAILFVIIVVSLFLGSLRAIAIPFMTIPLSLLGAVGVLLIINFTLNAMTLLAFALAIGLVVDDAIVVLENIHRHIEAGMHRFEAAIKGLHEIAPAIFVMTLVVAVVFVPIAFTTGITGVLFQEFAFTLSITVLFSGLFALVLSPMMSSRMLHHAKSQSFGAKVDKVFTRTANIYQWLLVKVIKFRLIVVTVLVLVLIVLFALFKSTPSALLPQEDQGVILGIGIAPTYASIQYSERSAKQMMDLFDKVPERESYGVVIGWTGLVSQVVSFLVLKQHQPGMRTENQIIGQLAGQLAKIPGVSAFPMNRPPLLDVSGFSQPVGFVLQTTGSYEQLYHVVQAVEKDAESNPHFINVQDNLKISKPSFAITINRIKAADLGVPVKRITDTLNLLLGKPIIGWFASNGWSYPVVPQAIKSFRMNPESLQQVYVRSDAGKLVELSNLISFKGEVQPQTLNQFSQLRSATISANLTQGYTLGQALTFLQQSASRHMTSDMSYTYSGESRIFKRESGEMGMLFLGALLAVYLLMVAKFSSFVDPFIVLISVPLSMIGAFAAMRCIGADLNIYTQIGLLMLIGLISKQGILIVDFANHIQANEKKPILEAVIEASVIRLRPILMTTFAMVFGAIPLVFSRGAGHTALQQIGAVIIGGLIVGSLFSLFVIPTIYTLLGRKVQN